VEIHVHDFDPGRMQHLEVGAGCVDFAEYASFFFDTEAWTTVEVRPAEAAARSRRRLVRDLGIA
jgi:sugar phosphate isomerase/epimerase